MFLFSEDKKVKTFFFFLACLAGIILLYPFLDFQPLLSQGDHGANLYAFQQTADGKIPYKDFWYPYGPLMPYYYAFFLNIFGDNIQSVLIGFCFLKFLAGIFCFLALSRVVSAFLAFIGSVWFWVFTPDFFITFNHNAVFTLALAALYCLFSYIKTSRKTDIALGLLSLFLILLIRVNMGVFLSLGFFICVFWIDAVKKTCFFKFNKIFSGILLSLLLLVSLLLFYLFSSRFPSYSLKDYSGYFHVLLSPFEFIYRTKFYLQNMIAQNISSWQGLFFLAAALGAIGQTIMLFISSRTDKNLKNILMLTLGTTLIFMFFSSHEYLASGITYRLLWMAPFEIIFLFLCLGFGTRGFSPLILSLIYFTILLIPLRNALAASGIIQQIKRPRQYLALKRGHIYTANSPQWVKTVTQTTQYLDHHLKEDESFLALPYEPLYYFTTGKKSPLWHLLLIGATSLNQAEEQNMIQTLEEKKINYIVLSNRAYSRERGLGILGETYLKSLYQYIVKNFEEVETFGNWEAPAGWVTNHATKIFKRK